MLARKPAPLAKLTAPEFVFLFSDVILEIVFHCAVVVIVVGSQLEKKRYFRIRRRECIIIFMARLCRWILRFVPLPRFVCLHLFARTHSPINRRSSRRIVYPHLFALRQSSGAPRFVSMQSSHARGHVVSFFRLRFFSLQFTPTSPRISLLFQRLFFLSKVLVGGLVVEIIRIRTNAWSTLTFFFLQKPTSHARVSEKNVLRREGCRKRLPLEASLRSTLTFYVDRISLWARLRCSVHHSFPRSSATTTSLPIYSWLMPVYRLRRRQQTPA